MILIAIFATMVALLFFLYGKNVETAKTIVAVEVVTIASFFMLSLMFGWWSVPDPDTTTETIALAYALLHFV